MYFHYFYKLQTAINFKQLMAILLIFLIIELIITKRRCCFIKNDLTIENRIFVEMIMAIASRPPESGGIIGGNFHTISRFHFDELAYTDSNSYVPNIATLNCVIQSWQKESLSFMGIVHSHDRHPRLLSTDDIAFAHSILRENKGALSRVFFILVICPYVSFCESVLSFMITPKKCCSITASIQ